MLLTNPNVTTVIGATTLGFWISDALRHNHINFHFFVIGFGLCTQP